MAGRKEPRMFVLFFCFFVFKMLKQILLNGTLLNSLWIGFLNPFVELDLDTE